MKKELLCPVGNMDACHAAIHNGADAIYLAGKSFGARAFATNFTDEEIVEVIKFAHLYNVRVYVTVNTLIKDTQIDEAIEFIDFLHKSSVDAVILQDIGLSSLVHKTFPNLELHASTQMHNLDSFTCKFLENLGFKRVVVARELSIDEINKLDTKLEIEAFIHGALCMCYSGQCLISSMAMNRSGNLGACSQLCRMPYELLVDNKKFFKEGKYLLSPKDLCAKPLFLDIMNSNITSLKIEGRMKSVEYVAVVTRMYRKLIDAFYEKKDVNVEKEIKNLNQLFNRGYSIGHLKENNELMNIKRGNHLGVAIGKTLKVNDKFIEIKLDDKLSLKDGIKFDNSDLGMSIFNMYKNGIQIKTASSGEIITIPNNVGLKENDVVLKTVDDSLNELLKNYPEKKIDVDIIVTAKIGEQLKIELTDGKYKLEKKGSIVEKASNKEVTYDDILDKITKLGNTPFIDNDVEINKDDNIYIRLSDINNLRRELTDELKTLRIDRNNNYVKTNFNIDFDKKTSDIELSIFIRNEFQLNIVKNYKYNRLYTDNYELYKKYKNLNIFYEVKINDTEELKNDRLLITSTSDIEKYKGNELVLNYNLNVFNSYSLNELSKYGLCTYSPELTIDDIKHINKDIVSEGELLIHGKVRVMTMKHCLLFDKVNCSSCKYNSARKELVDSFERRYTVLCNKGINYLYDYKNVLKIKDLRELKYYGIRKFRIDLLDEKESTINNLLKEFYK